LTFDFPGYSLIPIQKKRCKDETAHLFTYVYKFYSPITKYWYVINADYHETDVFVVKFYPKPYKRSDFKYNKTTNKGDVGNILITCIKVIPDIIEKHPTTSFGFIGAPSIDKKGLIEGFVNNQRFKIYSEIAAKKIGTQTFAHSPYPAISGYLLINKLNEDIDGKEIEIKKMFAATYNNLAY
jgi:hypothetical protein